MKTSLKQPTLVNYDKVVDLDGKILFRYRCASILGPHYEYRYRGKHHRLGGPAIEGRGGLVRYYVDGCPCDLRFHTLLVEYTLVKKKIRPTSFSLDEIMPYVRLGIDPYTVWYLLRRIASRTEYRRIRKNAEAYWQLL